jgi:hypothetical protein
MSSFVGNYTEFKPWKTEIARFTFNGNLVTLHSTGQAWISKPDGVLVAYREMPCRFGCMEEI